MERARSLERLKGHRDRDFTELEVRGKGNRRAVTVGIWRNGSKNGIGAEKKPVELANQIKRQKMERLREG